MTKIICTIGPSSNNPTMIRKMAKAGMDIARLNFSHGTHKAHEKTFSDLRESCPHVAIAIDIAGPKIRLGELKEQYALHDGDTIVLTNNLTTNGTKERIAVNHSSLHEEVKTDSNIFINDGLVQLRVIEVNGTDIICEVVDGGIISSRKGVNVPDSSLTLHVPTKKDEKDLEKACELEADFVFVSFVRNNDDLNKVKEIIQSSTNLHIPIISKIEHKDGVKNIKSILDGCDGLMVARGDLGIEVGPARVPVLQRKLIELGAKVGKPIIVATQMLESMINELIPTRAEASDVAHAVFDRVDAVMLSGETATGSHPSVVIKVMDEIIREAEKNLHATSYIEIPQTTEIDEAIGRAAVQIGKQLSAKSVVALTQTGYSARMVSKNREILPIYAVTPNERTLRKVQLYWGVKPAYHPYETDYEQLVYNSLSSLFENKIISAEDTVVLVSGSFLGIPGNTNTIQVLNVQEVLAGKH